ncbi:uncharacterized protein LOC117175595 [Belonocnema kinseyi]|uniref:uncharacterized protein LOC117175595 n=1 Tax=Belonocnema kinseyi TaxID=2817044 RepID=UPI00143D711C|nr:uncharacterized protein LOC117175595 [Belonocnema kinseyi]
MPDVGKWALLLGLLFPLAWAKNENYQMNDVCKNHFLRDLYRKIDGAVLTSQNERNLDCAITFQTHSILQRFMLRFDRLQLDCNDHLYIYDGAHAVGNYKVDLSCRSTESSVSALYTRTNFVTLKYVTDAWGTDTNGFRLVISAIKDPKHACKDFRCTTKEFCIDTDLVCDGIRHCEDGSDEAASTLCANPEASTILGMEKTLFAVAMVFIVLSMVGIVAAGVLCFCRQRTATTPRHLHNTHNTQAHPPVIFPLQQMYGSNGASTGMPAGMTSLKSTFGSLGPIGTGITGATTLPRPGNWLHPAGLRHGHSAARVRLYCQAK